MSVAVALVASGCASSSGTTSTDLEAYLARAESWAPVEAETARTIKRILETQFVDEAEVRHQIADNRPRILAHLDQVRAYVPRVSVIARIHERYVAAWQRLLGGYEAIENGFTSGDYTQLARGREAMAAWREGLMRVATDLRELRQRSAPDDGGAIESRVRPDAFSPSTQRT